MSHYHASEFIRAKRDGLHHSAAEITSFVHALTEHELPDYQVTAWLMAAYFRGLDNDETTALTRAMWRSGTTLRWGSDRLYVDKHSTGGVGDKVSLVLAPLLAACGVRVPMISGRGLGATGGTLDKLEAIPGFETELTVQQIQTVCDEYGCVVAAANSEIAPADRRLYALRDVTATVESIPLITASILSKKLAAGLHALTFDIKWGSGAFMKTRETARALALSLISVAHKLGLKTEALVTDMNQPLGRAVGHAAEVNEALDCLEGRGPEDLWRVTSQLAAVTLVMAGKYRSEEEAHTKISEARVSGAALDRFMQMVAAQQGTLDGRLKLGPMEIGNAARAGYVSHIDAQQLALAVIDLGGGRLKIGDSIDHRVGLEMLVRRGDVVGTGQPLVHVYAGDRGVELAHKRLAAAITISDVPPEAEHPLIVEHLTLADVA